MQHGGRLTRPQVADIVRQRVGNPVGIVGVVLFIAGQHDLQIPAVMDIQGEVQQLFLPANPSELETQIVPISPSGDKVVIDFPLFSNRHRRVAEGFRGRGGFIPVFFNDKIVGADGIGLHPPPQPFRFFGVLQLFKIAAL